MPSSKKASSEPPTAATDHSTTTASTAIEAVKGRGRPQVHTEPWAKITVVLLDRHVAYLDRLSIDIRLKHGKAISRAELIRALVEAAEQSKIDFSDASSMEEVTLLVLNNGKKK